MQQPRPLSFGLERVADPVVWLCASSSPKIGLVLSLGTLFLLEFHSFRSLPIWPSPGKTEHPLVFAIFWGLMGGLPLPFLWNLVQEEGLTGLQGILLSD